MRRVPREGLTPLSFHRMYIGLIVLIALIVLVCQGPGAILRALAGPLTLAVILIVVVWLISITPWAQEQARRTELEQKAREQVQQHGGQLY
jgi:uncharacterized membrane protein YdjX (TVP38/TMEM64 family)